MTASSTPSTSPHPNRPPTSQRALELYRRCRETGVWAKCVLETKEGVEQVTFCSMEPVFTNPGARPASEGRRRRNRRRRMRWLEKLRSSPFCTSTPPAPAPTADSPPTSTPPPTLPLVALRMRAKKQKIASSSEEAIPQLDGADSPASISPSRSPTSPQSYVCYPIMVWSPPAVAHPPPPPPPPSPPPPTPQPSTSLSTSKPTAQEKRSVLCQYCPYIYHLPRFGECYDCSFKTLCNNCYDQKHERSAKFCNECYIDRFGIDPDDDPDSEFYLAHPFGTY